jgi:single-stranded-DNA-specific exonuclease
MLPLSKHWKVAGKCPPAAQVELQAFPELLRQILYNRGYATFDAANRFLKAETPPGTEPENMLGIPQAVERIEWAIQHKEPIVVYGDYDVDGVTATALLTSALQARGAVIQGYIPNRFDEGYGVNVEALDSLYSNGTRLVITVDCGIRSPNEALHAQKLGLDLIITDHHAPTDEIPVAAAIVNPKQPGDTYPDKDLAGVGLAYKLAVALYKGDHTLVDETLDLVALGTVADLAPLVGENRALVRAGLKRLQRSKRQGLLSLMRVSGLSPESLSATHIGFALGPRLNAAGRLDSALDALRLLLTQNLDEAALLAQQLDDQNRDRQRLTHQIQEQAEQIAMAENPDALLLFAAHPSFNPGVVGLAASRLMERYYRPAIVAFQGNEFTRASCRSIPEFHITQALDQCANLLEHHGGHAAAAGFTVRNDKLPVLLDQLRSLAQETLGGLDLRPTVSADAEIPLVDLSNETLNILSLLEPTGQSNPLAHFVSRDLKVKGFKAIGREANHLRLYVTDGKVTRQAIAFRQARWVEHMPMQVDLLYHPEINDYYGEAELQLHVHDLKPSGSYGNP